LLIAEPELEENSKHSTQYNASKPELKLSRTFKVLSLMLKPRKMFHLSFLILKPLLPISKKPSPNVEEKQSILN
jgi:hypothetical protein